MNTSGLSLVPVEVDNPTHMAELRRQRVVSPRAGSRHVISQSGRLLTDRNV